MKPILFADIIAVVGALLYLVALGVALKSGGFKENIHRLLALFLGLAALASLLPLARTFGLLPDALILPIAWVGIILLTFIFYLLTRQVLQVQSKLPWLVYLLAAIWLVAFILVGFNLIRLKEVWLQATDWTLTRQAATLFILIAGWAGFLIAITAKLLHVYRNPVAPLVRNRAHYWSMALAIIAGSDILYFAGLDTWGGMLRWPGMLLVVVILIRPYMPDIRQVERQALNSLVMFTLTAIVLLAGLLVTPPLFERIRANYNPTLAGAVVAIFLAALLGPLWNLSQKIVQRVLPIRGYDPNRILREYSQSISNILDPELLATVAVGLISEAIEIQRGYLFLVDYEPEEGSGRYRLRGAKGMGEDQPEPCLLATSSPIAEFFRQDRKPLRQSDIDLLPRFQEAPAEERQWLTGLGSDVYMPIYTKEDWVGLIALGPKLSGLPYFDDDLALLSILADQTAIALQNARLVESLMRLNNDFRRAYAAMEQANRHLKQVNIQLESLDRTKSDFISVASHELRTPLTVMRGYNEMLLEDPAISANAFHSKLIGGIYTGILRLHEIVNSMLDMASIDTRSLELKVESVSIHMLIHMVISGFKESLEERKLTLEAEGLRDLPEIDGDPEALRKVFYHVIINAIKYTPDGGKVTITGVPVSAGQMNLPEGGVEIIVADTGIGIAPEYKDLIFTKFYQTGELALHSTGRTKFKGAGPGLGLAIAKGIVEGHRGKIWAESPGHDEEKCPGSQFHIVLPIHYREQ